MIISVLGFLIVPLYFGASAFAYISASDRGISIEKAAAIAAFWPVALVVMVTKGTFALLDEWTQDTIDKDEKP